MANCAQRTAGMANAHGSAISSRGWLRVNAGIGLTVLFFIFSAGCITGCGAASGFAPSANNSISASQSQPPTFTTIYNFGTGGSGDGWGPESDLVRDSAGNLYGTTKYGGNSVDMDTEFYGTGTVFKIDPSGYETLVHKFSPPDGAYPLGGLVFDSAGNLYGTTFEGGSAGFGTVFKLDPSGNYSVLHSFTGTDGQNPEAGLAIDLAGNLYGTTARGGDLGGYCQNDRGCGTVFKIDPAGSYSVLHTFTWNDGASPVAELVIDQAGNLYGTTAAGGYFGAQCYFINQAGCGTVFKIDPSGNFSVLHTFVGIDGKYPDGGLVIDPDGNLYGTTSGGGTISVNGTAFGTVFKIDPSGNETVVHEFTYTDGAYPTGRLVLDSAGNLYGTTGNGDYYSWLYCFGGCGNVFKIDPAGTHSVLYSFTGIEGKYPSGGLTMDPSGNLYGTTRAGGSSSNCPSGDAYSRCGTVFKITLTTPFSAFDAKLNITAGPHARLQLKAAFTQDSGGGAIDPVTQGMMLALGPYTATIPAGEFHMRNKGLFLYEGTINGVALQIRILQTRANSYQAQLEASGMDLTSLSNPVPVTLTIGSNTGTTQVTVSHGL